MLKQRTKYYELLFDLKHYKKYLQALNVLAKGLGLKILYKRSDSDGIYVPKTRKIFIDPDLSQPEEIATILHELGHAIDDTINLNTDNLEQAYKAIYTTKYSKQQKKLVIDCEKRAWKNGRGIAKQLKIRLGMWYTIAEKASLKSYRDN